MYNYLNSGQSIIPDWILPHSWGGSYVICLSKSSLSPGTNNIISLFVLAPIDKFYGFIAGDWPSLWSNGHSTWLKIQRFRLRFPVLREFQRSIGSRMGPTQPREDKWATRKKSSGSGLDDWDRRLWEIHRADHATSLYPQKVGTKFRRPVAVDQSVSFACGLKATEFFWLFIAGAWRQKLDLPTGPNWVGSSWRRRHNPVFETLFKIKDRTMHNVQNCDSLLYHTHIYIYIPALVSVCPGIRDMERALFQSHVIHTLTLNVTLLTRATYSDGEIKWVNSVALSPQANYTDRATATCRRNLVSTSADRGVSSYTVRSATQRVDPQNGTQLPAVLGIVQYACVSREAAA
jgi:hypothetical protein